MAQQQSSLEKAIGTLVSQFHSAAGDSPTLKADDFKSFLSAQLPNLAKTAGSEQGMGELMQIMGVKEGGEHQLQALLVPDPKPGHFPAWYSESSHLWMQVHAAALSRSTSEEITVCAELGTGPVR
ncbi:hypothetical protein SKAU_G00408070 [Synaphobranchus kaupii]|uniref:S100/CaBP-9k-type calcium binding subdomain domain-containing protein n=1 Tax=Synaphobranchus kaupii TaxID=118154 RepID=A0A9Q1EAE0_SYNKA|nr:hypothetical protein SKAU_G00408070 [Synaphobranchus kaupii]